MQMQGKTVVLIVAIAIVFSSLGTMLILTSSDPVQVSGSPPSNDDLSPSEQNADGRDIEDIVDRAAFDKVLEAYEIILQHYVMEVDEDTLLEGAINGMMNALDDPYSVYMDPDDADRFNTALSTSFEGIGAEVTQQDGRVTIISPIHGSPAEEAGLRANDQILEVNGEDLEGLDLYIAVSKIRGPKGSEAVLKVHRPGVSEPMTITVTRDEIPIETVYADITEMDNFRIGKLKISSFGQDTAARFAEELHGLEARGIDGLVIDVRSNPGGYLEAVNDIGKLIVPDEQMITRIESRNGDKLTYRSTLQEAKPYPITVLINEGSASASEILAAAMQEAGGYEVIGEASFGKGTVQRTVRMEDSSEIKITMAKWVTTNENWIEGEGVQPDIEIEQPDYFYAVPIQSDPPLAVDMNNDHVQNMQTILAGIGYVPGRTDGFFDAQTERAVQSFQRDHDLDESGVVDEDTAVAIQNVLLEEIRKEENDAQLQRAIAELMDELN